MRKRIKNNHVFARITGLIRTFDTEEKCLRFISNEFYPEGMNCPHCNHHKKYHLKKKFHFKCANKNCGKKYNVLYKTMFHSTKIPLTIWFEGIYRILSAKKGVTSHQLAKDLSVAQSTAYHMNAKIQEILDESETMILSGKVEADELMHGPIAKWMHKDKKPPGKLQGRSYILKTPILGLVERGPEGKVILFVLRQANFLSIAKKCLKHVKKGSTLITDEFLAYRPLRRRYKHLYCNHGKKEFVSLENSDVHTNTVESFWMFLRGCSRLHQNISKKHLQRYCFEWAFKRNYRHLPAGELFCWFFKRPSKWLRIKDLEARPTWFSPEIKQLLLENARVNPQPW